MKIGFKDNKGGEKNIEDQHEIFDKVSKVTTNDKVDDGDKEWYKQTVTASKKACDLTTDHINNEIKGLQTLINTMCSKDHVISQVDLKNFLNKFAVVLNDVDLYLNFSKSSNMYFKKVGDEEDGK